MELVQQREKEESGNEQMDKHEEKKRYVLGEEKKSKYGIMISC